MSRILIAVSSCHEYEKLGINQSQRDTWLADAVRLGMDYHFFHGLPNFQDRYDVVTFPIDDSIWGLTNKLKLKVKWGFENGYDFIFSCFPDTYARPERLLSSGFERFDYFGSLSSHVDYLPPQEPTGVYFGHEKEVPNGGTVRGDWYCHGGAGYLLSRRACEVVVNEPSSYLNDDCWLGDIMRNPRHGLSRGHSDDICQFEGHPRKDNSIITSHLSHASNSDGVKYTAAYMYNEHKAWLDSLT